MVVEIRISKKIFEKELVARKIESNVLTFEGLTNFDVYNCSQIFTWKGKKYIFGRVEKRNEWMHSWVCLFEKMTEDTWALVENSMIYQLEDPFVSIIEDEIVLGGTHVRIQQGRLDTYCCYFYRGKDLDDLRYFTTGPQKMKDIRLVQLQDGRVGVFSRPHTKEVFEKFGSASMIGFTIIDSLEELSDKVVLEAPYLQGLFSDGEWGGCNQAFLLADGQLGVLGHISFLDEEKQQSIYMNMSFVLDPVMRTISDYQLIGTRQSYPQGPSKKKNLQDCAFSSGLIQRSDGRVDLYSGIGDTQEGRTVISDPFKNHGSIFMQN